MSDKSWKMYKDSRGIPDQVEHYGEYFRMKDIYEAGRRSILDEMGETSLEYRIVPRRMQSKDKIRVFTSFNAFIKVARNFADSAVRKECRQVGKWGNIPDL